MAEIKPFRAFRYTQEDISSLITPHYEDISETQLQSIYQNPFHSIHLITPEFGDNIGMRIKKWKAENIIREDALPAIYIFYQYYRVNESDKIHCRKGFICSVRITDWEEKIIIPHEKTIEPALHNRMELLKQTEMNITPVHGLYSEHECILEKYMDESMKAPIYEITDIHGVVNKLSLIHDATVIKKFIEVLRDKQIILADGHHRYNASLQHKKNNPADPASEFINMYLSNTENNEIKISATHRIIQSTENFEEKEVLKKIEIYFTVKILKNPAQLMKEINNLSYSMGLVTASGTFILELKKNFYSQNQKESELGIMQNIFLNQILSNNIKTIEYSSNLRDCERRILKQKGTFALIAKDISLDEIKKVCYHGFTFPAKTTYFYPKVISGLLFSSISKNDYIKTLYSCFKY